MGQGGKLKRLGSESTGNFQITFQRNVEKKFKKLNTPRNIL